MWHAVRVGAGLGSECREKWLCTWGGCVLDQGGCSWRCWRHPNASGVGVKVASAMEQRRVRKARHVGVNRHSLDGRSRRIYSRYAWTGP